MARCTGFMAPGHDIQDWEVVESKDIGTSDKIVGKAILSKGKCVVCGYIKFDMQELKIDRFS